MFEEHSKQQHQSLTWRKRRTWRRRWELRRLGIRAAVVWMIRASHQSMPVEMKSPKMAQCHQGQHQVNTTCHLIQCCIHALLWGWTFHRSFDQFCFWCCRSCQYSYCVTSVLYRNHWAVASVLPEHCKVLTCSILSCINCSISWQEVVKTYQTRVYFVLLAMAGFCV